jgi:hypothetical protein
MPSRAACARRLALRLVSQTVNAVTLAHHAMDDHVLPALDQVHLFERQRRAILDDAPVAIDQRRLPERFRHGRGAQALAAQLQGVASQQMRRVAADGSPAEVNNLSRFSHRLQAHRRRVGTPESIAKNTNGVKMVKNEIAVRP